MLRLEETRKTLKEYQELARHEFCRLCTYFGALIHANACLVKSAHGQQYATIVPQSSTAFVQELAATRKGILEGVEKDVANQLSRLFSAWQPQRSAAHTPPLYAPWGLQEVVELNNQLKEAEVQSSIACPLERRAKCRRIQAREYSLTRELKKVKAKPE